MEFIIAQFPMNMRGFMIELWFTTSVFIYLFIQHLLLCSIYILKVSSSFRCDSWLRVSLLYDCTVIFLVLAKYYKLYICENIICICQVAEDHYEKYVQQERLYIYIYVCLLTKQVILNHLSLCHALKFYNVIVLLNIIITVMNCYNSKK